MKQPASVLWLVHSLEVVVLGAVFTTTISLYQSFQSGTLTLQSAGVAAGSLLLAILGNALKGIVSNANFAQAVSDLVAELAQRQQAVSPVTIHNNIPAFPAPAPQPAQPQPSQPAPTQQFAPVSRNFTNLEIPAVQPAPGQMI